MAPSPNLRFIPKGLIVSVGQGGNNSDIELVRDLVTTYISRPSCLILLTVTCESEFHNTSLASVQLCNSVHSRLRKPRCSSDGKTVRSKRTTDNRFATRASHYFFGLSSCRCPHETGPYSPWEEDHWLRFIRGEAEHLTNGWFAVKQPGSKELKGGIDWEQAREQERLFFSSTPPWSSRTDYRHRFGTHNLTESLSKILSDLIKSR